jgi:hypothetical protein
MLYVVFGYQITDIDSHPLERDGYVRNFFKGDDDVFMHFSRGRVHIPDDEETYHADDE